MSSNLEVAIRRQGPLAVRLTLAMDREPPEPATSARGEGACPRSEELAAFVDGAVEAGDRRRLLAHLLDCQRCYAAFREVLLFRALRGES